MRIINRTHIGINVRNTEIPYADLIVDGIKTIETRDKPSLHSYIGKRIAIVRTGEGKAVAIGEATIFGWSFIRDEWSFRSLARFHRVPKGTRFDIVDGQGKYLYHLRDAVRYNEPRPVGYGIVSRKVLAAS